MIEVDGQEINLTAFQNVLNSIFEGQGNCTLSATEVSEKLLLLEEIDIILKRKSSQNCSCRSELTVIDFQCEN